MNNQEALVIVERALNEERLSKLQATVFCHAWEEQSYLEIAKKLGYEVGYVKQIGSQLWQVLSRVFGEKVTKSNVQLVLKRKVREGGLGTSDWGLGGLGGKGRQGGLGRIHPIPNPQSPTARIGGMPLMSPFSTDVQKNWRRWNDGLCKTDAD